jgi:hypothetical protein
VLPRLCGPQAQLPDLNAISPGLAPSLVNVVLRALSPNKAHRFPTAGAMASALRSTLEVSTARTLHRGMTSLRAPAREREVVRVLAPALAPAE